MDADALRRAVDELTLRDAFAAAALPSLLAAALRGPTADVDDSLVAARAYDVADAMLEERASRVQDDAETTP